jgi:CheY-like chemotaxis protein
MSQNSARPKILIVDDEIQMRFYLKTLVTSMGYEPVLAKNGVQGLDLLKQIKPAAIVLDIMMPEKGGSRVYQALVSHPEFSTIPVIFFSGVDRNAFVHHIKMLNTQLKIKLPEPENFVAKDADPEYLKKIIQTSIRKGIP